MRTNHKRSIKLATAALLWIFLISTPVVQAQTSEGQKPGPEQKKLAMFVGEWKYEGTNNATPLGPSGKFVGKMTSRMILKDLYLESKWEDRGFAGSQFDQGVLIQWYDPVTKTYPAHGYSASGGNDIGVTTLAGNTWTLIGTTTDAKGKVNKHKDTYTFSSDGEVITQISDISMDDGKSWLACFVLTMKKVETASQKQEIIEMENQYYKAMVNADIKVLNEILADEYTETGEKGELRNKDYYISKMKSGDLKFSSAKIDDLKVNVYGSAAVAIGRLVIKGEHKGEKIDEVDRFTDTWVMRNGHWQCVAGQWVNEEKKP